MNHHQQTALKQDALLAGLGRLTTAPQPARRAHRAEPFLPVSRVDTLEVVERATGLQRSEADHAATEKLLWWVRSASLDAVDVLRAIVAGSTPNDAPLNARVLAVVHWLCAAGGPAFLPSASRSGSARKPGPAVRVCLDVLKSFGHDDDAGDLLYDDNKVRQMRLIETGIPRDALNRCRRNTSVAMLAAAVETYAIALGRKLIFHSRYPDVEANYSLDRFFRALHTENQVDSEREGSNSERHAVIVSRAAVAEMALLTRVCTAAAQRLDKAETPVDIRILVLGEAANAYSYTEYLRGKLESAEVEDLDLSVQRDFLSRQLKRIADNSSEVRLLKKYVDGNVFATITNASTEQGVGVRPESRHRREIVCSFTSFEALHKAMAPATYRQGS